MLSALHRPRPRRAGIAAVLFASTLALSACGGSTVTSDDLDETTEPAATEDAEDSEDSEDADSTSTEETTESTTEEESPAGEEAGEAAPPEDQAAREISEIPPAETGASDEDQQFLETLDMRGIDVNSLENQLLSTANMVCAGDPTSATVAGAVAGQLIEQGRTDLPHEEVTSLIESSARDVYCPL